MEKICLPSLWNNNHTMILQRIILFGKPWTLKFKHTITSTGIGNQWLVRVTNTLVRNTVYKIGHGQWQGPTVSSLQLSIGLVNGQRDVSKGSALDSGNIQLAYVCSFRYLIYMNSKSIETFEI